VGRHELRVPDGGLADFARGLRELRRRAGNPSYQELAAESGYPAATLAAAAAGDQLPSLTVTLAYVSACGGDVSAWSERWRALSEGEPITRTWRWSPRVVLITTGLAVIVGAGVYLANREPSVPEHSPVAWTPPPPEYVAVTGPGCRMDFTRHTDLTNERGHDGWREGRGGSWTGDGCDGRFLYSEAGRPRNTFQWRFVLGGPADRRCTVEVFVPDSPAAATLVSYDIADRFEHAGEGVGRFSVDQAADRGKWVSAAAFPLGTAEVVIRTGAERGPVIAGPVRLSCSRA
jgi:hypothetical protein